MIPSKLALVISRSWTLRSRRALATRSVSCFSCDGDFVGLFRDSGLPSSSLAKSSAAWSSEAKPVVAGLLGKVLRAGSKPLDGKELSEIGSEPCTDMIRATAGGSAIVRLLVRLPVRAWPSPGRLFRWVGWLPNVLVVAVGDRGELGFIPCLAAGYGESLMGEEGLGEEYGEYGACEATIPGLLIGILDDVDTTELAVAGGGAPGFGGAWRSGIPFA